MARATSGLGQFRGKVGSVVFRVSQGQQIASAYQPAVKNPKSNLQTAQRNKMYLASQLSKLVPREDLIGLAPKASVRDRRNMFIRNIITNSTSSLSNGVFTSSVYYESILFSKGEQLEGVSLSTATGSSGNSVTITFDKSIISEEQFNRMALKLVQIDISNDVYSNYKSSWLNLGEYDSTDQQQFNITINVATTSGATTYIYLIPVQVADGVRYSAEKKTLIQTNKDSGEIVIQGVYAINNAVLKWFNSVSLPTIMGDDGEIVPPSTGDNEVVNPEAPDFPNLG